MRILFITDYLPYPPISGDRIRVYNLIQRVARQHEVWLATPIINHDEADGVSHLQQFCHGVETAELKRHKLARLPGMMRYALMGKPFELEFLYSDELATKIKRLASNVNFDLVQIEQSRMALYLETLPRNVHPKRVLVFHNVTGVQYGRMFSIGREFSSNVRVWLYSRMMSRWEPRYAERFDRCIAMSEIERRLLISANPRLRVNVIPNGVDASLYQPLPLDGAEFALLLIGNMEYTPCIDGAIWFCDEILPLIRRMIGGVQVWIVGRKPTTAVTRLNGNGVHVTGRVEDVVPYYRRSSVSIVPLRAGGGTRLKILEAMALGRPVVSTSIGCEGLDVVDGRHLLIADDPKQFAEKTVSLLTNTALYKRIAAEARLLVVTRYDWDVITKQLLDVYSSVLD